MTEEAAWRWLASTRELQETAYGVDFSKRETGAELADNLVHQGFALIMELAEAFKEVQWKDWARNRGEHDRGAMLGELVDVGHFLANLLVHFNVTDEEWEAAYREKQERNRKRQLEKGGYDADGTKCPRCHRELDKKGAVYRDGPVLLCHACDLILIQEVEGEPRWHSKLSDDFVMDLWDNLVEESEDDLD